MVNVPVILPVCNGDIPMILGDKLTCFALQLAFAFQLLYILALCLVKSSILCFYTRAFASTRLMLAVKVMFGVVAMWGFSHALAVIFICRPVSFQWDLTLAGKCGDQIKLFQSIITTNIVTDVLIMLLPVYSTSYQNFYSITACSNSKDSRVAVEHAKNGEDRGHGMLSNWDRVSGHAYMDAQTVLLIPIVVLLQLSCVWYMSQPSTYVAI
jgi:hypothetical protein